MEVFQLMFLYVLRFTYLTLASEDYGLALLGSVMEVHHPVFYVSLGHMQNSMRSSVKLKLKLTLTLTLTLTDTWISKYEFLNVYDNFSRKTQGSPMTRSHNLPQTTTMTHAHM